MYNYCDAIKTILKTRDDPAQLEDYFYLMLEDKYGYEDVKAKIEDYFENHSPFCFKVEGRDFRKENLSKDREWPMLVDKLWDDIKHEPSECRDSIKDIITILSREANMRIEETGKEEYDEYGKWIRDYEDMDVLFEELALPRNEEEKARYKARCRKDIRKTVKDIIECGDPRIEECKEMLNKKEDEYHV